MLVIEITKIKLTGGNIEFMFIISSMVKMRVWPTSPFLKKKNYTP